jgi:hypothetical protein
VAIGAYRRLLIAWLLGLLVDAVQGFVVHVLMAAGAVS